MATKRLTDQHPTYKKLVQLQDLADSLGIRISFNPYNTTVYDFELKKEFELKDIEDIRYSHCEEIREFPYPMEWKLIYDDGVEK